MSSSHLPDDLEATAFSRLHLRSGTPDVSVVLPCLDEEDSVAGCVYEAQRVLDGTGLSYEVIVVNNGSRDRSALRAIGAGAVVVTEPKRGYGLACRAGLEAAKGSVVVIGDADGTYDFWAIPQLFALIENDADLALGNRLAGDMESGAMPLLHRYVGTPLIGGLIRLLFRVDVGDVNCGLRAIRREAYLTLEITSTGMEFASEMVVRAADAGLAIAETPVGYRLRAGGAPKLRTWSDGWRHIRLVTETWVERRSQRNQAGQVIDLTMLEAEPETQLDGEFDADRSRL